MTPCRAETAFPHSASTDVEVFDCRGVGGDGDDRCGDAVLLAAAPPAPARSGIRGPGINKRPDRPLAPAADADAVAKEDADEELEESLNSWMGAAALAAAPSPSGSWYLFRGNGGRRKE